MAKLILDIKNQTLTVRCDIDRIVENSVNYLEYEINTTSDWSNLSKVVIVTYNNGKNSEAHSDGKIKNQLIRSPGFSISVVGTGTIKDPNTGEEKTLTIPTNEVMVKIYPSGRLSGDNNPSEEPEPGFGERMDRVEAEIGVIKNTIPAEGELQTIRDQNTEIQNSFTTINNTLGEHTTSISENASEIQTNKNNIEKNANDIIKNAEEIEKHTKTLTEQSQNIENNSTAIQEINNTRLAAQVKNNILYIDYFKNIEEKEG
jgi:hypothetical protein